MLTKEASVRNRRVLRKMLLNEFTTVRLDPRLRCRYGWEGFLRQVDLHYRMTSNYQTVRIMHTTTDNVKGENGILRTKRMFQRLIPLVVQ